MSTKPPASPADVDALVNAATNIVALYGLLCDQRQATLRECDSEFLSVEGSGFTATFYHPKRELEAAIRRVKPLF
jgi:hypothetical protein